MTDPRLHSTEPIDDEVPFQEADDVPGETTPEDEDAIVTPAAAERARRVTEQELEPNAPTEEPTEGSPG